MGTHMLEVQDFDSIFYFFRLDYLKEVYGIVWVLVHIQSCIGIQKDDSNCVIRKRNICRVQAIHMGPENASPLGNFQALADGTKLFSICKRLKQLRLMEGNINHLSQMFGLKFLEHQMSLFCHGQAQGVPNKAL